MWVCVFGGGGGLLYKKVNWFMDLCKYFSIHASFDCTIKSSKLYLIYTTFNFILIVHVQLKLNYTVKFRLLIFNLTIDLLTFCKIATRLRWVKLIVLSAILEMWQLDNFNEVPQWTNPKVSKTQKRVRDKGLIISWRKD